MTGPLQELAERRVESAEEAEHTDHHQRAEDGVRQPPGRILIRRARRRGRRGSTADRSRLFGLGRFFLVVLLFVVLFVVDVFFVVAFGRGFFFLVVVAFCFGVALELVLVFVLLGILVAHDRSLGRGRSFERAPSL